MDLMYSLFFGAGVAAYAYSRIGRRVGYGNTQNVVVALGVIFVLTTLFFFTILKFILHI
ncbi:MAG: hypothetical protein AAB971_00540 [Patescibacteria group bacterium]